MIWRFFGGLIAAAGSLVLGYFGFQWYLKWLLRGETSKAGH
jgi:hypothetical protein